MTKIEIETSLKSKGNAIFYKTEATKKKNTLEYLENDFFIKIDIIENCVKMIRKNSDYEQLFYFDINNSKCQMSLIDGYIVDIPLITKELSITDSEIKIIYTINNEEYIYIVKEV